MRFKDSKYSNILDYKTIELEFGTYYLTDKFILAEINDGVHFDTEHELHFFNLYEEFYPKNKPIGYITNRINSYSVNPQVWNNFFDKYANIIASAIITYSDFSYINATIEKQFSKKSLKRCYSIEQAIDWIMNLREFKNTNVNS